ncbi:Nodulin-like [Trema orientale]|uniref:Nodulin-like n=1 Tax=Trema orientale TaxID=63057 RepID=A0A2P5FLK7_TREOI|nr:Nodulin-like [Trema orientale]
MPKVWHMCLYIAVGANSHTSIITSAFIMCLKNFPKNHGVIMGLLTGYVGIRKVVIAQLYRVFYEDDTSFFTLFSAWLPIVLSSPFVRSTRIIDNLSRPRNEARFFFKFLHISMSLASFSRKNSSTTPI